MQQPRTLREFGAAIVAALTAFTPDEWTTASETHMDSEHEVSCFRNSWLLQATSKWIAPAGPTQRNRKPGVEVWLNRVLSRIVSCCSRNARTTFFWSPARTCV